MLKNLPCVKQNRLIVGGPSVSKPIHSSKGFEFALVSYHADQKALAEYLMSEEHMRYVKSSGSISGTPGDENEAWTDWFRNTEM
jgi:hypothetical protein